MKNNVVIKNFKYDNFQYSFKGVENEHFFKQIPWYEQELLEYISNLNLNGVYVDVGGNIGNHSLFFANHCNSTKLYIFEPENFCFNILNENLSKSSKKQYVLRNIALWNKKDELNLIKYETYQNTGISKVIEKNKNNDNLLFIISNTLDDEISLNENVVLIKIDTEGAERKILDGGINLIKNKLPVIICEAATSEEFKEIDDFLKPLGYKTPTRRFNATPTYIWVC